MIPTEEPIGPPDPLPYPSDDPTGIFVNLCVGSVKGVFYSSNLISFFSFVFIRSQTIDHWFCGISLDDANTICKQHCPTATECPMSQSKSWQDAVVGGGGGYRISRFVELICSSLLCSMFFRYKMRVSNAQPNASADTSPNVSHSI